MSELMEITGEELELEQPLEVMLTSVGNPDHGQDPSRRLLGVPRQWRAVESLGRASEVCRAFIVEHDLGGGNWNAGLVRRRDTKEELATVSYNGRVWHKGAGREAYPVSYVVDGAEVYALLDDLDGVCWALNGRTYLPREDLEEEISPRTLQPIDAAEIDRSQKGALDNIVARERRQLRIAQRKRSALSMLEPLGFRDSEDWEAPGMIFLPGTGFQFDCKSRGPGEIVQELIAFGRKQGKEELQSKVKQLLGL